VIVTVLPNSPAAVAGLQTGDVIKTIDSHRVCSLADLQSRLYVTPPGGRVLVGMSTAQGQTATAITLSNAPS
jgi:S1-C subfamily serine protease